MLIMKNLKESLQIELSEKEPCMKKAEVTIPADAVSNEVNLAVKEFAKFAQLPGFRSGKAPQHLIKKRFASNINEELSRRFQVVAFEKIREESSTDIVTMPAPEGNLPEPVAGEEFKFALTFSVAPEIKLPTYKAVKLKKTSPEVPEKDIDAEVDRIREMYAEFATIDEAAKEGDMLKITYTSDLEASEDASAGYKRYVSAEDSWCWLSDPEMLPGIIKALKGVKSGAEKKMDVVFPDDFSEADLIGKKAKYNITVAEVQRKLPIKSDEEFCKRINVPDINTFREQIKQNLMSRAEMEVNSKLQESALEVICSDIKKLDLPPDMLAYSVQKEFRAIANNLVKSEDDVEAFKNDKDKHQKDAEEAARQQLTRYFICKRIADEEGITVEQSDIDSQIAAMSRAYGHKEKDLRKQMEANGGIEDMHLGLTISKVLDFVVKNADIAEPAKKSKAKSESKEIKQDDKK
jgi:trigger factor